MKLWLIRQDNSDGHNWHDHYDAAVVVAATAEEARRIHPSEEVHLRARSWWEDEGALDTWTTPDRVEVREIGLAHPDSRAGDVICASFNEG